ncbi:hypothetical protein ACRAWB_16550 [Leifsonia poae]|uniref:hypothetical protein n=1 Tax=Leifsonia poae TaxID=110933 RepID=UPI003D6824E6
MIVDAAATGPLDAPINGYAYVNVNGWQPSVNAQLATIDLPQQQDTPVMAPAIAGIALLGASGISGAVALKRRKKTATPTV